MIFVYCDGEDDCKGKLGTDIYCSANEEFAYNTEDRDNATTAVIVYKIKRIDVIIEFDEDDIRCLFIWIGVFQLYDIRDLV